MPEALSTVSTDQKLLFYSAFTYQMANEISSDSPRCLAICVLLFFSVQQFIFVSQSFSSVLVLFQSEYTKPTFTNSPNISYSLPAAHASVFSFLGLHFYRSFSDDMVV